MVCTNMLYQSNRLYVHSFVYEHTDCSFRLDLFGIVFPGSVHVRHIQVSDTIRILSQQYNITLIIKQSQGQNMLYL